MIFDQNITKRSIVLLFFVLFFSQSFFGQDYISDIRFRGRSVPKVELLITDSKGVVSKVEATKRMVIKSESIIDVPDPNITVDLTSVNGNVVEITGPSKLQFRTNERREEYRLIEGGAASSNILINVYKELTGGVLASGPTDRIQAKSRATEFLLNLDGEELTVVLKQGKIDVNSREKFEIKDEIVIGNENKRAIFTRETRRLNEKDSTINYNPTFDSVPYYASDSEIKKFLDNQFRKQKRMILKAGSNSKKAFRQLNNTMAVENGISAFKDAIENGELSTEFVIQSAFLFADSYYIKNDMERSLNWLEAGLSFNEQFYGEKVKILNDFKLNSELVNAFRYDMLIANEYYAWGFDIKLKINGCLENADENPTKYRSEATKLIKEIERSN